MARSVMSRLSPPRSLMSSAERPVPMPRTSASRLTSTSTSTTTSSKSNYQLNINSNVNYNIYFTKIVVDIAFPSLLKSITIITEGPVSYRRRKKQKNIVRSNKNEQYSTSLSSQHQKKHVTSSTRVVRIIFSHSICFRNCNVSLLFLCIIILAGK